MSKSRNNVTSQVTPASMLAKHSDTLTLLATSMYGMKQATDTIQSAKELQTKSMETVKLCIRALRADKVMLGDARNCGFTKALSDTFEAFGLSKGTVSNYLVDVKRAVNKGEPFVLNSARAASEAKKKEAAKQAAIVAALQCPADIVPPASESREGSNVKTHTNDTVRETLDQDSYDPFTDRDSSNGSPVQVNPNASVHQQISGTIQALRAPLTHLFNLLGQTHQKSNQEAITAIREELNRIEQETLEAMKR
jgi:hypothetical protein